MKCQIYIPFIKLEGIGPEHPQDLRVQVTFDDGLEQMLPMAALDHLGEDAVSFVGEVVSLGWKDEVVQTEGPHTELKSGAYVPNFTVRSS